MTHEFTIENLTPLFYEEAEEKNSPAGMLSREIVFGCVRVISLYASELFNGCLIKALHQPKEMERKRVLAEAIEKFMVNPEVDEEASAAAKEVHKLID